MGIRWRSVVVCLALLLTTFVSVQAAPRQAPAFEIGLLDGTTFRLADHRGTAVILLFWAPW